MMVPLTYKKTLTVQIGGLITNEMEPIKDTNVDEHFGTEWGGTSVFPQQSVFAW